MTEIPTKTDKPPYTHTAWVLKTIGFKRGQRFGRWINEGDARVHPNGTVDIILHSLPIGGFNGHIHLAKIGNQPPDIPPTPQRPDGTGEGGDEFEE